MAKRRNITTRKSDVYIKLTRTGKWAVQKSGNKAPSFTTNTQKEAIAIGRTIAKKNGSSMVIYNIDGNERRRYYNK